MKYITVLFDGMADYPDENGDTPMQLARKPITDALSAKAEVGLCATVPEGYKPGSDVANLSVMGYDPRDCYTGRSPLEAVSMGIPLTNDSITYRCNLVTLSEIEPYEDKTMIDYSAGEISTDEARELIEYVNERLGGDGLSFYPGVSYRHCLKRDSGTVGAILTPPHDISDRKITDYLPRGLYAAQLRSLMERSYELLKDHPVNLARKARGKNPADSVWLWGEGTKPRLENFTKRTGLRGAVISAVDLIKGIALGAGMQSIDVAGATGTLETNFRGKAQAAIEALKTCDYVYVHLEAPDECGHQGDKAGKTLAIERIDAEIVGPIVAAMQQSGEPFRMLIMPDHATPYTLKTHVSDPIPYLLYDSRCPVSGVTPFTERTAAQTSRVVENGSDMLRKLLQQA